jgi:hypothetical protein
MCLSPNGLHGSSSPHSIFIMKSALSVNALFALAAPAAAYTSLSYTNVSDPYYGQSPPVYPSRKDSSLFATSI